MPTTTLTVKLINQPGSTGRGSIVGTDDQRLGIFHEKASLFEVGKTYEIEYVESDRNGRTLRNVKSAKQVAAPVSEPFVSGAYRPPASPALQPAAFRTPEQMFVSEIVAAYIASGRCANPGELKDTIAKLREVWRQTFGFDDRVFTPSDAGKPRLVAAE
jgi:hypothetical protein